MKHFNIILRLTILSTFCCIGLLAPQEAQARSGEECPDPVVMPTCSWQSDINRAFAKWKNKFDYDDCDISEDLDDLKPPKKCTGGTVTVTLDDCDSPSDNCSSSFTVEVPPPPMADCPADKEIGPCVNEAEVAQAFEDWLDEFEVVDQCDVNDDLGGFVGSPTPPPFCGGSTEVTFIVKNKIECYEPFKCTRTFTVLETQDPVLICPMDRTEPACLSQAEVQSRFQAWLNEFQVDLSQSCPGTTGRFLTTPLAPGKCGGMVSVTYVATTPNQCGTSSCTRTFTVLPDNIAPMGTCPDGETDLTCLSEVPEPNAGAIAANYTDNCGIVNGVLASVQLDEDNCDFTVTHNYQIYDDCGNSTPCSITYSGGDNEPPAGNCPVGGEVASLNDVPTPNPDAIASNYTDNCGTVWAQVLSTSTTGTACTGFTVTQTYSVGDNCGKDNNVICAVSYTVAPNGETPIGGTCPAPVTGLQCWDDVPTAAQAQATIESAYPGATAVYIGSTNINNYCQFSFAYAFSITDPCTGNRTVCVLKYEGQDLTPPAPTNGGCPAGVTASTVPAPDPAGVAAGYTDNCSSVHAYRVATTLNGFDVTYHYRVYDDCDNNVVCSVTHTGGISRPGTGPATAGSAAELQLKAYPNPTSGELFLEFGELPAEAATITLSNLYGQQVFTRTLTVDAPTQQLNLQSEGLSNGTYLLTVRTKEAHSTQRIVLNR
ncbi:MAG: T9SS type A sorting domain-containing protein [Lewinellaceae bacterium]|nr:T9SS type A sorting domain-containing protein [Lewinellaceae bacterium]